MHFARSEYLNLLWGLPVLAVFFAWSFRQKRKRLELLVGRALVAPLTMGFSRTKAVLRALLLCGFFTSSVLALARPQWGTRLETIRRKGLDLVIALDTSYSMNTEDIAPSRLEKAKREIRSLIARLRGDRVGAGSLCRHGDLVLPSDPGLWRGESFPGWTGYRRHSRPWNGDRSGYSNGHRGLQRDGTKVQNPDTVHGRRGPGR